MIGLYYTDRTLRVNEDRQVTEVFTKAIDQLGHSSLEIRLGGIYSLERVAADSIRDTWPVIEVLAGFIRDRSSRSPKQLQEIRKRTQGERFSEALIEGPDRHGLPQDIQAAMSVIGRQKRPDATRIVDLHATDLRFLMLARPNLTYTSLVLANLNYAGLVGANLRYADLGAASLDLANLEEADLSGANLRFASVRGANLRRAKLLHTSLQGTDLSTSSGLTKDQLAQAQVDQRTKLPLDLRIEGTSP